MTLELLLISTGLDSPERLKQHSTPSRRGRAHDVRAGKSFLSRLRRPRFRVRRTDFPYCSLLAIVKLLMCDQTIVKPIFIKAFSFFFDSQELLA